MTNKTRKKLTSYAVTALAGGALSAVILVLHGFGSAETAAERYTILCDAFTIPGILMIMIGLLLVISGTGALDGISYAIRGVGRQLIPFLRIQNETFYDFVQRKDKKRKTRQNTFLFVTGAVFLAAAIVFLVLFEISFNQ